MLDLPYVKVLPLLFVLAPWLGAKSQLPATLEGGASERLQSAAIVMVGRVLDADGNPAVGAQVFTSAGGLATSAADGGFALELEPGSELRDAQVTALWSDGVGGPTLVAEGRATRIEPGGIARVGSLVLALSGSCEPDWQPTFGGWPGTGGRIFAQVFFDDGGGPALYVGGEFSTAGGVSAQNIAKWDGSAWSPLGKGTDSSVRALTVFDDGTGPALYAGGSFTFAGGIVVNRIARWDGSGWSALGSGTSWGGVLALAAFDDGSGPALYAGGQFGSAGGVPAANLARWNGSTWSSLGAGMNYVVESLCVFDDGTGSALYAGGSFSTAGGVAASRIAKWDGASWSPLGAGMNNTVSALTVFDDGSGPALHAGGSFSTAGGAAASQVAKWNGTSWSPLGAGVNVYVFALTVFDDGSGPALLAGGIFTVAGGSAVNRIARWDGATWSPLGGGIEGSSEVRSFAVLDDGSGAILHVGGSFASAGGQPANNLALWDGSSWSALPSGLSGSGFFGFVSSQATFDDGGGPALFVSGSFKFAAGLAVNRITKWDGQNWSPLGSGLSGLSTASGEALEVFDDGSGPKLYVGGTFTAAGGVPANRIAKWNGSSWSALGSGVAGISPEVKALAVYDDGHGPALHAGGRFTTAGGVTVNHIARWDGTSWSGLGTGLSSAEGSALKAFDDGTGPALYVGGSFSAAGGVGASRIARWDGTSWSALGSGVNGPVNALEVFDDGSGPELYVAGDFTSAGGIPVNQIARWDGTRWEGLGGFPVDAFQALRVYDDGSGPALHGAAVLIGDHSHVAKWTGSGWTSLMDEGIGTVRSLHVFDDGSGPALIAGGYFVTSPAGDSHLARFGGCAPTIDLVGLAPDHGPLSGGNRVRLVGSGFVPGTTVTFAGEPVPVTFLSSGLLEVVAPAGSLARHRLHEITVDVVATTPYGGRDTLLDGYAYASF